MYIKMPRKYQRKRYGRRPRYRKKPGTYRRKYPRRIPRLNVGMPTKKLVRLRFVTEKALNPGLGGITNHYFSANSLFKPDASGTSHQPLYYDQFMTNYDHYRVIGSKIKVTAVATNDIAQEPGVFGIILDDEGTMSYTTAAQIIESNQGGKHWRMATGSISGMNTNGSNPTLFRTFSAKKFFSKNTSKQEGSTLTSPSDQAFFNVWYGSIALNDPGATAFIVEIEYIAILSEPKFVAQS